MDNTIFLVLACLGISFVFSELFFKLKLPKVVGQILAGMVIALPFVAVFIITPASLNFIQSLSELGIVFLLLLTGLEVDLKKLLSLSKPIFLIAIFSALIPFGLGFVLMKLLGFNDVVALVVGACLALTAEGTKVKVLMDFNVLRTRLGEIMLGAGIVDDLFEILFLALVLVLAHESSGYSLTMFPFLLLAFVIVCFAALKLAPKVIRFLKGKDEDLNYVSFAIIIGLGIALFSQFLGLGPIIGALIAGLLLQVSIEHRIEQEIAKNLKLLTFGLVIPFFFIYIGLNFNPQSILLYPFLFIAITFVAFAGKILGSVLAKFFSDLSLKQSVLVGWGMNSRGAVELVIAEVARANGLIPVEVYSVIVLMAIITTLNFPLALQYNLKKYPNIMN